MKEYIRNYLERRKHSVPVPTGVLPVLQSIPGIRAVLFDIYGTLLISSSGDIDIVQLQHRNIVRALEKTGVKLRTQEKLETAACLDRNLKVTIKRIHREKMKEGVPYPEVDIIEVWKEVLDSVELKPLLKLPKPFDYREFAFIFEMYNNPVSPMPGLKTMLERLSEKKIISGIISNAQFYTPLLLHYFLTGSFPDSHEVHLFSGDCIFFSYQYLRAKPDRFLFDKAKEKLSEYAIPPENVLYAGNDMRNDILPAAMTGFRTVLFAGDRRSLRLREEDSEAGKIKPDAVITELSQLFEVIGDDNKGE